MLKALSLRGESFQKFIPRFAHGSHPFVARTNSLVLLLKIWTAAAVSPVGHFSCGFSHMRTPQTTNSRTFGLESQVDFLLSVEKTKIGVGEFSLWSFPRLSCG